MNQNYVQVICRLKPLLPFEERSAIQVHQNTITISDRITKTYTFDGVFEESKSQEQFTDEVTAPLVDFIKNGGQRALIFSYGITNSGKTYSILGTPEQPGILMKIIRQLAKQEEIKIMACQLYKDEFYSLKNKGEKIYPKEIKGTLNFDECEQDVINDSNAKQLFEEYLRNRACSSTNLNSHSSRSHAIFKIMTSKLNIGIVDLAGSQRLSKIQGIDKGQTIFINKSLLTLKKCILALQQNSELTDKSKLTLPYRQSKLTQALIQYFSPTAKINIIVNINQSKIFLEQNLLVMDYTSIAKNIKSNANSQFALLLRSAIKSAIKSTRKQQKEEILQKKIDNLFSNKFRDEHERFLIYLQVDRQVRQLAQKQRFQAFKDVDITQTPIKIIQKKKLFQKKQIGIQSDLLNFVDMATSAQIKQARDTGLSTSFQVQTDEEKLLQREVSLELIENIFNLHISPFKVINQDIEKRVNFKKQAMHQDFCNFSSFKKKKRDEKEMSIPKRIVAKNTRAALKKREKQYQNHT